MLLSTQPIVQCPSLFLKLVLFGSNALTTYLYIITSKQIYVV